MHPQVTTCYRPGDAGGANDIVTLKVLSRPEYVCATHKVTVRGVLVLRGSIR